MAISQLSDSSFFGYLRSFVCYNDNILMAESDRAQIFVLDKDLQLVNIIGSLGRGPNELMGANYFHIHKDTIIASDLGNNRVQFFNILSGDHLGYVHGLMDHFPTTLRARFIYKDSIFIGSAEKDSSLVIFDLKSNKSTKFGERYEFGSETRNRIRNYSKNIFSYGDNIISISDNQPLIERYDYEGNIIEKYDYSDIPLVKEILNEIEKVTYAENSYFVTVTDCNIFENRLFLLLSSTVGEYHCNTLLEFEINEKTELCNIYKLPDKVYTSIAYDGANLFSYSYKGEIQRFKL